MPIVRGRLRPAGQPWDASQRLEVALVDIDVATIDDGVVIVGATPVVVDDDGAFAVALEPNSGDLVGTRWRFNVQPASGYGIPRYLHVLVPDGAGPYDVDAIRTDAPPDPLEPDTAAILSDRLDDVEARAVVPDPAAEPDDRWLRTDGGVWVTTGAPVASVNGDAGPAVVLTAADVGAVADDDPRLSDDRPPEPHAATHADGGSDEIALDASQVTGGQFAAARIPNLDAAKITSGELDDARLPATIARDAEVANAIAAEAVARDAAIAAAAAAIMGGLTPADRDTILELATLLAEAEGDVAGLLAAVAGKQDAHANLTALAGLVGVANRGLHFTGAGALAVHDLTVFARQLLAEADAAAARTRLGLGTAATHAHADYDPAGSAAAAQAASQPADVYLATLAGLASHANLAAALRASTLDAAYAARRYPIEDDATAARVLATADEGKLLRFTSATAVAVTIPANATDPIPVGAAFSLVQSGAGQITVGAAGGVTLNGTPTLKTRTQHSTVQAIKTGADRWLLVGDLAPI